jgi:hypothetical protein
MSKVKVSSWQELYDKYGKRTPDGVILPIHLRTGQLDDKIRIPKTPASPYPSGAHVIPIITLGIEGIDNVQETN